MEIRVVTCDKDSDINWVFDALNKKKKGHIFWGNTYPYPLHSDYLFVHYKGDSTIMLILKVKDVKEKSNVSKKEYRAKNGKPYSDLSRYPIHFIVTDAREKIILLKDLKDGKGKPKKSNAMREMSFVNSNKFKAF